jgi:AbrB family looped-hinge helix DNA binding protein
MPTATMTSKGQTTIPVEVRRELGLAPGDRIDFIKVADGRYEVRPAHVSVGALRGLLAQWGGARLSDDDAIMAGVAEDQR